MSNVKVIVVTGLPGAGKTTLARELVARYRLTFIAKDLIKEPLLDVLGAHDAEGSRQLSNASFAVMFSMARELTSSATPLLLEGNFRPGEHEDPLRHALGEASLAQILCRVPESVRVARLSARESDSSRHAGHRFGERLSATHRPSGDAFLEVPSLRLVHDGADVRTVFGALDDWMNLRAPSL